MCSPQCQFSLFVCYYVFLRLIESHLGLSSLANALLCILQFATIPHWIDCTCTSYPTPYWFWTTNYKTCQIIIWSPNLSVILGELNFNCHFCKNPTVYLPLVHITCTTNLLCLSPCRIHSYWNCYDACSQPLMVRVMRCVPVLSPNMVGVPRSYLMPMSQPFHTFCLSKVVSPFPLYTFSPSF